VLLFVTTVHIFGYNLRQSLPEAMSRAITRDEVARHNAPGDMWLTIDGRVYDVSKFAAMHPGGEAFIHQYAGKVR
jgi:cytochrome b involved in lipid metabolism